MLQDVPTLRRAHLRQDEQRTSIASDFTASSGVEGSGMLGHNMMVIRARLALAISLISENWPSW
jgi:hypothetical protein